jgi:hypothetical protein
MNFDGEVSPLNMPELKWEYGTNQTWCIVHIPGYGRLTKDMNRRGKGRERTLASSLHTFSLSHKHTHTHTHIHCLSLALALYFSLSRALSLTHSLSLTHTHDRLLVCGILYHIMDHTGLRRAFGLQPQTKSDSQRCLMCVCYFEYSVCVMNVVVRILIVFWKSLLAPVFVVSHK